MNIRDKISRRHMLGLDRYKKENNEQPLVAEVKDTCLAVNNIACRACEDHCDVRAIRFIPTLGMCEQPRFDPVICTGCNNCVSTCPNGAISLVRGTLLNDRMGSVENANNA